MFSEHDEILWGWNFHSESQVCHRLWLSSRVSFPLLPQLPTHREAASQHMQASSPPPALSAEQSKEHVTSRRKKVWKIQKPHEKFCCLKILNDPCKTARILTGVSGNMHPVLSCSVVSDSLQPQGL